MKVKDIQIDGFGVWSGLSVDSLTEGMTLFYGPNEAGKTTLMQFIRTMLYGFTDQRRDKYLPPIYGGTPGGAMRVTGPGGGYMIRRQSQLTDQGATGQLTVTGEDGLSQGQHRLSSLLGQIDEPIFTNVFAIGMRELQELSTLDDTSAADELYKLSSGLDRVSLVDVLRSLRGGRKELLGKEHTIDEEASQKLSGLIRRREQLRDEVERLTRGGRRWSELATQRRTQRQEVEHLTERMIAWEKESRCVEVATNVFEAWSDRDSLIQKIAETEKQTHLPEEAPGQLVQIEAMMEERKGKLEEVKNKRRAIRDKAEQLPVSRRMLDLQGRIEAAAEQATWVEALEEQIARLDGQIEKARGQLEADAERLGMDEGDRVALLSGDTSKLPDLSRQTLAALAGPAKGVKENAFVLKQARSEGATHKTKADRYQSQLKELLDRAHASNLQEAIRNENDLQTSLRRRLQISEHLEKLKRHYRGLEKESVELTTDEALPLDRLFLLALPFIVGGSLLIYGLSHIFGIPWFISGEPDPTRGMMFFTFGVMSLLLYYFARQNGSRSTSLDLEDCDRQIDTLRRQIREVEAELGETDSSLPNSNHSIEQRVRESETLLEELEEALPTYHAYQASLESYKSARSRASSAADRVRAAKQEWTQTLQHLGLSETLSPTSVRKLSEGYETLQGSRRRLAELNDERDQRSRERQTISKRIEMLYLEALEVNEEHAQQQSEDDEDVSSERKLQFKPRNGPLEQLNHLHEELARQQHWIRRRRELKEQDLQLKRQQSAHHRSIERGEQQRRALWAKCGVATPEQFYQMVDLKSSLVEMRAQVEELNKQIRSIIGTQIDYDDVAREIEGAKLTDLERRWEALTTRMTETESRIAALRTQQGELAQEMKQLGEDNRLTVAQLELGCVERQINAACRRWQTLAMASSLMEDVCATIESERQPETLREASSFLSQLTDGKYNRIWTPLGTNKLKIDSGDDKSLPLEVLSRGTREAVFIALRLSLAAAYARRGVMLPLVLDDVLVNFDGDRAIHAANTLKTFAELGHQVMMFTCHQHIVDIFHEIEVEVRLMPPQGEPGRATVLLPEEVEYEEEYEDEYEEEAEEYVEAEVTQPEVIEEEPEVVPEPEPEAEIIEAVVEPEPEPKPEPKVQVTPKPVPKPQRVPEPRIVYVDRPRQQPEPVRRPARREPAFVKPQFVIPRIAEPEPQPPAIGWAWYEREPADGHEDSDERRARAKSAAREASQQILSQQWASDSDAIPDDVLDRNESWWDGHRTPAS
tara:strand:+ start:144623 stop:148444 length:3822 start_codon:yes stop_codon:yes gene_type:complete